MSDALVIGAGPAGLMATDEMVRAGLDVTVAEAKPSLGRKFLMAGKSGLNLTKDEPFNRFLAAYEKDAEFLAPMLKEYGPTEVQKWAIALEQDLFTGTTGRVFPKTMKASPLLRAWLGQLNAQSVTFRTRWHWRGWQENTVIFDTPEGMQSLTPKVTVLACGGASWARLGSNGAWASHLPDSDIAPFQPANMGFLVDWSDHMSRHLGKPIKGIALTAGNTRSRGEMVLSREGIEGGGVYTVSKAIREGADLILDLMPDQSIEQIRNRLARSTGKNSLSNHLRKTLKLDPAKQALLMEFARPLPSDLAPLIKSLTIVHKGARAMDQAISTAGGLRFETLDTNLMLRNRPGTFAAGEMLDWEAPTGGYLITACLATGRWAGRAAAQYVARGE